MSYPYTAIRRNGYLSPVVRHIPITIIFRLFAIDYLNFNLAIDNLNF